MSRTIIGESTPIKQMTSLIQKIAPSKTNVLVIGESGTGKELVARMLHDASPLKTKAFVPINCGAIPENLIESELFGHKRGSFTGAVNDKVGLFEVADGGTLFLDEIGELPLGMQAKLLRSIQEQTIRRIGGTEDIKIDVRVIAATNRDLEVAIKQGTFREDLYYRLNVIQIRTPPLRERKTDILILAKHFLKVSCEKNKRKLSGFEPDVEKALTAFEWPGNVRELQNVIERAVALEAGAKVSLSALPHALQELAQKPSSGAREEIRVSVPNFKEEKADLPALLEEVERAITAAAALEAGGSKKKLAALLGIPVKSVPSHLKRLKLASLPKA